MKEGEKMELETKYVGMKFNQKNGKLESKYVGNSDLIKWKYLLERPEMFKEGKPAEMVWELIQELFELERAIGKYIYEYKQGTPHPYTYSKMKHRFEAVREALDKPWTGCFVEKEEVK